MKGFAIGGSSKPGGKLTLSKMRTLAAQQPARPMRPTSRSNGLSLVVCEDMLAPADAAHRTAPGDDETLKVLSNASTPSVFSQPPSATQPLPFELESFSFTESDLLSHNSYLKTSFPSLPSSTQASELSTPPLIRERLPRTMDSAHSFVSAGAGPHCPPPTCENGMDLDSTLVQRGSRARVSRIKQTGFRVLSKNFGTHVLSALRMAFKSYEPAVQLMRKSLKGPDFEADGEQLEQFAYQLMERGEVTRPEDLCMLTDVLQFTYDILAKVLAREAEVRQNLPAQKMVDFALDGPVMCELRRVIVEVGRLEEEHQKTENEMLAAEFEDDSFQFQNSPSAGGEKQAAGVGMVAETGGDSQPVALSTLITPATTTSSVILHQSEKGEPQKKRHRASEEETSSANFQEFEEPHFLSRSPSCTSIAPLDEGGENNLPLNQTLARTGAAALLRVQK